MEEKYILALERKNRFNDYLPIDLKVLGFNNLDFNLLENIDKVTSRYTYHEIKELIIKANIVTKEYYDGNLCIRKINSKLVLPVVYMDTFEKFDVIEFIYRNINNKNLMNSIYTKYDTFVKNVEYIDSTNFKDAMSNKDISSVVLYIETMPFLLSRSLKFYMLEKIS